MNAPLTAEQQFLIERADRQALVVRSLKAVLPEHALLWNNEDTTPYECDGLTAYRQRPLVVVLPETYAQVQAVLKTCHALNVPVVARGAGTGLSGGAMPHKLGVTLSLAKFNKILKLDPLSRTAVVQGGVRNLAISEAAAPHGLYYAPDPSSTTSSRSRVSRLKAMKLSLAATRWMPQATTCSASSSAAKACWPSRLKSPSN